MGLDRNKHLGLYEKTGQLCRKRHRAESSSAQEKIAFNDEVFLSSVMHPHVCVRACTHTHTCCFTAQTDKLQKLASLLALSPCFFVLFFFGGVMGQRNIHIDYLKDNVKKLKDHLRKVWKRLKGKHTSAHMLSHGFKFPVEQFPLWPFAMGAGAKEAWVLYLSWSPALEPVQPCLGLLRHIKAHKHLSLQRGMLWSGWQDTSGQGGEEAGTD